MASYSPSAILDFIPEYLPMEHNSQYKFTKVKVKLFFHCPDLSEDVALLSHMPAIGSDNKLKIIACKNIIFPIPFISK
jgi:hypothetical protein